MPLFATENTTETKLTRRSTTTTTKKPCRKAPSFNGSGILALLNTCLTLGYPFSARYRCSRLVKMAPETSTPKMRPRERIMFRTPPATPSLSLGAEPMMALLFGGVNSPMPTPRRTSPVRSSGRCAASFRNSRLKQATAETIMPLVVMIREPYLSERWPETGATIAIASGTGVSSMPVSWLLKLSTRCR